MLDRLIDALPSWAVSLTLHGVAVLFLAFAVVSPSCFKLEDTPLQLDLEKPEPIEAIAGLTPREIDPCPQGREARPEPDIPAASWEVPSNGRGPVDVTAEPNPSWETVGLGNWTLRRRGGGLIGGEETGGLLPSHGTPGGAIQAALRWLARRQQADGTWVNDDTTAPLPKPRDHTTGVTALAILAFLECGITPHSPAPLGSCVRLGLGALVRQQDADGCIGERGIKYMYDHVLATRALCIACFQGASEWRTAAGRAVEFTLASQNPGAGWRYCRRSGDNDSVVTGFAVLALAAAERAGFAVPRKAWDGARAWFEQATVRGSGLISYDGPETCTLGRPFESRRWRFDPHPIPTALGILSLRTIDGDRSDKRLDVGLEAIRRDPPRWEPLAVDFTYWTLASRALREFHGSGSGAWREWREKALGAILANQNTSSVPALNGSWMADDRWSEEAGRVYATSMNALTLRECSR